MNFKVFYTLKLTQNTPTHRSRYGGVIGEGNSPDRHTRRSVQMESTMITGIYSRVSSFDLLIALRGRLHGNVLTRNT